MTRPPAGIPHADWQATPSSVRDLLLEMVDQNQRLSVQVTTLATRVTQLEEQKGRSSRNSSKPPSSTDLANAALVELDPAAPMATLSVASGAASRAMAVISSHWSVAMR